MKLNYIQRFFSDTEVGAKLVLDGATAKKTMKEFKQEVKDARTELLNVQATFGATSKEALNAAKKVAELEDAIKDASETTKLFDPGNKFQVLGNAVRGLVGGFTALQGALALAGVEGEDLQKTLLKVQGALALTEGLNVVADMTKDFQRLGSVMLQTFGKNGVIGIAVAGVAALTAVIIANRNANADLAAAQKEYNKAAIDARLEVAKMQNAFNQARLGIISKTDALNMYNEGMGKTIGQAKNLNEAEKLMAENASKYVQVQGLKAKANFLLQKSAELTANAEMARIELEKSSLNNIDWVRNAAEKKFKQAEADAQKYRDLIVGINNEIAGLSSGFKTTTTPTQTGNVSPRVQKSAEENKAIELLYSTHSEEMLLRQQQLQENLKNNKQFFIEEGLRLEQAEFDEKIWLLNAEVDAEYRAAQEKIRIAEMERSARMQAAKDIGGALGALSELIGRQTAAGKALAIAQAVINTWVGVTEVLRAKSTLPEPFATISKIANVTAIVATGLNAVKNIAKQQVPGASGGGSAGSLQSQAPLQPRLPQATNTLLDANQLNQIGNATVRAFVVESDVSSGQERIRRLNRAARI